MRQRRRPRTTLAGLAAGAAVVAILAFPGTAVAAPGEPTDSPSVSPGATSSTDPSGSPSEGASTSPTSPSERPTTGPTTPNDTTPGDTVPQDKPVAKTGYVRIDSVTPKLTPGGKLTVKGAIVNGSDKPLTHSRLRLEYKRGLLSSRDQLQSWASHPQTGLMAAELPASRHTKHPRGAAIAKSIAPGDSAPFRFAVKASDLDFTALDPDANWGVRGIAVELTADDGSASGVHSSAPSFTTWYPSPHLKPSHLGTLIPISGPRDTDDDGLATSDDLRDAVSGDGNLTALLDGASDPAISWAVDPSLLQSIKDQLAPTADTTPTTSPTSSPSPTESADPELSEWYRKFTVRGKNRSVLALPWGDPDLQALTKSKLGSLLEQSKRESSTVTSVFPDAVTSTAWPMFDTAHRSSLLAVKRAGYKNVLLSSTQLRLGVGYTPTATGKLPKSQTGLGTVTADATLSSLLASLGRDGPAQKPESDTSDGVSLSPISKGQDVARIVAETASITHERPSDPRSVLMAAPRNFTPDGESLHRLFDKLDAVPWMTTTSLKKLMATKPDTTETFTAEAAGGALNAKTLNRLVNSRREFDKFSAILAKPVLARDHLDRELLSLASVKWHGEPGWKHTIRAVVHRIASDVESVSVVKGSPVLLVTGDNAKLAVQVQNNFDKDAHVVVRMSPETPQLQGGVSKPITIPAHRGSRVEVPVKGLANADVKVEVSVESPGGRQVGTATTRTVRVRADWENIGTAIIGGIVALIFIFGIVRTLRRGRVKVSGDDLAAAETLVHSRLETGEMPVIRPDRAGRRRTGTVDGTDIGATDGAKDDGTTDGTVDGTADSAKATDDDDYTGHHRDYRAGRPRHGHDKRGKHE